jgi:catechol-2,3-dioxygenase
MKLSWSHAVVYVRDQEKMIGFYTQVLGFTGPDRGPLGGDAQIIFMSQEPEEHHQLALVTSRKDDAPSNTVNHFAFRVSVLEDVTGLAETLGGIDGVKVSGVSHGNTLSIYFNDPEGNGIEVFWDTPWHVAQPQGKPWDVSLSKADSLNWIESVFGDEQGFVPREDYYAPRREAAQD